MWGKSTPALLLVYIFFALHHASEAHERVLGQHAAGVGECICNLANMVNYTNIACVDAPMWYQHIWRTTTTTNHKAQTCLKSLCWKCWGFRRQQTYIYMATLKKKETDTAFQSFAYVYWTFNTLRKNTGVHNCSSSPTLRPSSLSHSSKVCYEIRYFARQ